MTIKEADLSNRSGRSRVEGTVEKSPEGTGGSILSIKQRESVVDCARVYRHRTTNGHRRDSQGQTGIFDPETLRGPTLTDNLPT